MSYRFVLKVLCTHEEHYQAKWILSTEYIKVQRCCLCSQKFFSSTKGGDYKHSRKGGFKRSKIRKWNLHVLMNCFDPMVGGRSSSLLYNKNMIPNTTLYLKKYVYLLFIKNGKCAEFLWPPQNIWTLPCLQKKCSINFLFGE